MTVTTKTGLIIPDVPWPQIRSRLLSLWRIDQSPHHSVIGLTGSGKSYLCRYGILETCIWDRVLFIDGKGDDATIRGLGKVVNDFPNKAMRSAKQLMHDDSRRENWYRLVTSRDFARARQQVKHALESVMKEGNWIVVVDELRYITDTREPGLNLAPQWEAIMLRGRSRGVGLVNLTQEPRWVRGSFYTQPSFMWISRVEDEAAQKRISEIGSSRALMEHLPLIPKKRFIYMDNLEDQRFWAYTQVPSRGRSR